MSEDDPSDTETTVSVNTPSSPPATEEREDEVEADRAYFAPRALPKAALPTDTAAAKVVINVPGASDEVTLPLDANLLAAERVREERARRREPTVRIARKDVAAVRAEIAAAERAGVGLGGRKKPGRADGAEIPVFVDDAESAHAASPSIAGPTQKNKEYNSNADAFAAQVATEDGELAQRRSGGSKAGVVVVLLAALGAVGGATWYFTQREAPASDATNRGGPTTAPASSAPPTPPSAAAANATSGGPEASTAAPVASSPPLELSATPTADPSVVTLDTAAAQTAGVQGRPVYHPPTTYTPPTGATHPTVGTAPHPPPPFVKPGSGKLPTKPAKPGIPTEI